MQIRAWDNHKITTKLHNDFFEYLTLLPGARPTKHISIEFEIRRKLKTL